MSHNNPIISIPLPAIPKDNDLLQPVVNAYYSSGNANMFRPLFDEMIATRDNLQVLESQTSIKANTLYQKANYALRYLIDTVGEPYTTFRARIVIRRRSDRILLYYKQTVDQILAKGGLQSAVIGTTTTTTWRDDLQEWIAKAKSGDIYDSQERFKGIVISPEERQWLVQILSGLDGVEIDLKEDGFRVCR